MQARALPKIVGLTGGIASGKSSVRRMLETWGVPCVDVDQLARAMHQNPQHPACADIARHFPQAMSADGRLTRGSLRTIFARDARANRELIGLLLPHIAQELAQWTAYQSSPYVVWEAALLLESGLKVDRVLLTECSPEQQIERIQVRNPEWTLEQSRNVIALQIGHEARHSGADDIITNDGSLESLQSQVQSLHRTYLNRWSTNEAHSIFRDT